MLSTSDKLGIGLVITFVASIIGIGYLAAKLAIWLVDFIHELVS